MTNHTANKTGADAERLIIIITSRHFELSCYRFIYLFIGSVKFQLTVRFNFVNFSEVKLIIHCGTYFNCFMIV